jgi:hypothetical protein
MADTMLQFGNKLYSILYSNYKLSLSHMLSDMFYTNSYTVLGLLTLTANNSEFHYHGTGLTEGVTSR